MTIRIINTKEVPDRKGYGSNYGLQEETQYG